MRKTSNKANPWKENIDLPVLTDFGGDGSHEGAGDSSKCLANQRQIESEVRRHIFVKVWDRTQETHQATWKAYSCGKHSIACNIKRPASADTPMHRHQNKEA